MNEKQPNKLIMPEGVASVGAVKNITEAYMKSILAIPEMLSEISESLSLISLYFERKGIAESLFTKEELDGGIEDGGDTD